MSGEAYSEPMPAYPAIKLDWNGTPAPGNPRLTSWRGWGRDWRGRRFPYKFLFPIQAPILNRLADVGRRELGRPCQIRNCARDLEDPMICARGETQASNRLFEHGFDGPG